MTAGFHAGMTGRNVIFARSFSRESSRREKFAGHLLYLESKS
jgi:hypothetical protein